MINLNGTLISEQKMVISYLNRGFTYGDSLFETLRFSGGKIFFWEDHYFRLMASMRILRMEIPMFFTLEYLEAEIKKTISNSAGTSFRIKIQVWRKEGGKYTPENWDIEFLISYEQLQTSFYTITEDFYEVELYKDHYITSGQLSTLKSTSKIINVLGSIFASENKYANCLLLNEKKEVVEALNGNLFLVHGKTIKTPSLESGCLNGIVRKQLIAIIDPLPDYSLEIATVSPFELQKADEIFITNVVVGMQSISKYRKKEYTNEVANDLLGKLNMRARLS